MPLPLPCPRAPAGLWAAVRGVRPRPGNPCPAEARSGLGGPGGSRHRHARRRGGRRVGDRPTVIVALVALTTVVAVSLLCQGLATRILAQLSAAVTERDGLKAELDAAHRTKEELRNLAYHDDLTGLPNRSLLHDRLGLAIAHADRQTSHVAVLFIDLDDFKAVNDSFGHAFGDRFLVELATRLRSCVRGGDTVARFGGDEFVVLLDSVTGADDAAHVASKVRWRRRGPVPTRRPRSLDWGERRSRRVPERRHVGRRARDERRREHVSRQAGGCCSGSVARGARRDRGDGTRGAVTLLRRPK